MNKSSGKRNVVVVGGHDQACGMLDELMERNFCTSSCVCAKR